MKDGEEEEEKKEEMTRGRDGKRKLRRESGKEGGRLAVHDGSWL